ncbi:hypothetical protein [Sphingomonas soli]|uniref:hypothetical protein n=1 Tax=Sphingomonas soli TaxID=266127 RepID=UPI00082E35E6|nr:hypothetical protein [Sphingomonas soli]
MRKILVPFIVALPLLSGGCIAKTIVDVATLPVKAAGQGVDWATTSQEESDRNYGRKMRKKEAAEGAERKRVAEEEAMRDAELKEKQRNDRKHKKRRDRDD